MESAETKASTSLIDMKKKAEERVVYKKLEEYFNKDSFVHFVFLFTIRYALAFFIIIFLQEFFYIFSSFCTCIYSGP
jgi:hypothetical protein